MLCKEKRIIAIKFRFQNSFFNIVIRFIYIHMSNSKTMSFISSAVFWGAIIILFGLSIILREVFHIHIPFVKIIFGFILIYWGVKMIAGGFGRTWNHNSAVFSESKMYDDGTQKEYNIIFGSGTIDLFKIENTGNRKIEINVVFGNGILILNDSIPTKVEMSSVFGSAEAPDKSVNALGKTNYMTSTYKEGEPFVFIDAKVVLGKLEVQSKRW